MGPAILSYLLDFWFGIFSRITGFILEPVFRILVNTGFFDENYLEVADTFMLQLYDYISFSRDVIINITGLPPQIFYFLGGILIFCFAGYMSLLSFKFLLNCYALFRSGKSAVRSIK